MEQSALYIVVEQTARTMKRKTKVLAGGLLAPLLTKNVNEKHCCPLALGRKNEPTFAHESGNVENKFPTFPHSLTKVDYFFSVGSEAAPKAREWGREKESTRSYASTISTIQPYSSGFEQSAQYRCTSFVARTLCPHSGHTYFRVLLGFFSPLLRYSGCL